MENNANVAAEDVGNIVSLEHVNLTVPDQATATLFYLVGLGFTRDPYLMVGPENMWVNVGQQQFHLPTRAPQVIPGHIGLVVNDLDALRARLKAVAPRLEGTRFAWSAENGRVAVTCPWGNRFRCHAPGPAFGDMAIGIPYVEFLVKPGAAAPIARFYREVLRAPATVTAEDGTPVARVPIGGSQALYFRETDAEIPPYDGHHIAVYIADVSGPYNYLAARDRLLQGLTNHQFRFKDILDPDTGEVVFELEHEVRSLVHPMFARPLVNRDPTQSLRNYRRGGDALVAAV